MTSSQPDGSGNGEFHTWSAASAWAYLIGLVAVAKFRPDWFLAYFVAGCFVFIIVADMNPQKAWYTEFPRRVAGTIGGLLVGTVVMAALAFLEIAGRVVWAFASLAFFIAAVVVVLWAIAVRALNWLKGRNPR